MMKSGIKTEESETDRRVTKFFATHRIPSYRKALLYWYGPFGRDLPWRRDFRRSADPYGVWISEVMLQQTQIQAVIPAYERFMVRFPSVGALAAATVEEVCRTCHGLGYYRRFRLMHEAARGLAAEAWPGSYDAWRQVRGIGDYSAAAIASIVLGLPCAVVDGNVKRIFCRLLDIRLPVADRSLAAPFTRLAQGLLTLGQRSGDRAAASPGDYNQALMELGQRVCTRRTPQCAACPFRGCCLARERTSQELAPAPALARGEICALAVDLFIRRDLAGRVALVRRDEDSRLLKMSLGFPWQIREEARRTGAPTTAGHVGSFRHAITHHRLDVRVHLSRPGSRVPPGVQWVAEGEVDGLLVTSLDRKAWRLARTSCISGG